jgi:regulator of protease activity HflC (stomatin/prohibitin superfamily)
MNRQLSAERTRRAVITESEGRRQSEINIAEGAKQAAILTAEGERQAQILRAEGTRQSQILNAEGFGQALTRIYESASAIDQKTMLLQYLEALKRIGESPSTKYIIPAEFTQFVGPLATGLGVAISATAASSEEG